MPSALLASAELALRHAIAMCNLCELAAGTMIESTLPASLRWIPKGMTVRYLKKAETDLIAKARMSVPAPDFVGDLTIPVQVHDGKGGVVMEADITMYVSLRKEAARQARSEGIRRVAV